MFIYLFDLFSIKAYADDDILNQVKDTIENFYIGEVSETALKATSMEEMIKCLGDPYTQFFTHDEFQSFTNSLNMRFIGIGVYIESVKEGFKVSSVMFDTPAMEVGIKDEDIIVAVNEFTLLGLSVSDALNYINGQEGAALKLTISRENKNLEITVVPRKIPYATVMGEVIKGHIGYIRIATFGNYTSLEFDKKLLQLKDKNVDSYVIDLRNNPGGYLYSALDIAGYFIGKRPAIIIEDKDKSKNIINAFDHSGIIKKPVVFLINDYSASAAEILSAAVKDYKKAFFLGTTTYGKGVAQTVFNLSDGSILKTTTVKYYSPKGSDINYIGVSPDLQITNIDPIFAAELLLSDNSLDYEKDRCVNVKLDNRSFEINLSNIKNRDYWEAYRLILSNTSFYDIISPEKYVEKYEEGKLPKVHFAELPSTTYKVGERISFKLDCPNYKNKVQYRAILWDDASNQYRDLWSTPDRYYTDWVPRGNEIFNIGFPALKPGTYRIKFFVKRSGVPYNNTALEGMNSDSYLGEIPYIVVG